MNQVQKNTRTASQRIDDLEQALMTLFQTANNMASDLTLAKDAIKLLGNKLDSVVSLLAAGTAVNDDSVSDMMVQNNISNLKEKVTKLVNDGLLSPSDAVTDNSFFVGHEVDETGKTTNPRLQFSLSGIKDAELREKLKTAKIGEITHLQEGKASFILDEVYEIQTPKAPAAEQNAEATQSSNNEES